jgi:hypothetical protein
MTLPWVSRHVRDCTRSVQANVDRHLGITGRTAYWDESGRGRVPFRDAPSAAFGSTVLAICANTGTRFATLDCL